MTMQSIHRFWDETLKSTFEKPHIKDLVFILFLLLAGWKYLYNFQSIIDIELYDEASYMRNGLNVPNGLPPPDYAPLYAVWYYVLSLFQPDRVQLYYLNYVLVTILPVILLYLILRRYGVGQITSGLISAFFLISYENLIVWPKVGHFGLIVVLTSLFAASYFKSRGRILVYALGALLASYIRPEFSPVFVFLGLFAAWRYYRQWESLEKSEWVWFALVALFSLLLIGKLGLPVSGGERANVAFGQHFSLNWVSWTHSELDPWLNWQTIMKQNFRSTVGPLQALTINPDMFLRHVSANLLAFLRRTLTLTFTHANFLFPIELSRAEFILISLFTLVAVIIAGRRKISFWRERLSRNFDLLLVSVCYLLVSLTAAILIFPRDHYLLLPILLTAIVVSALLSNADADNRLNYRNLFLFGLVLFAITPQAAAYYPLDKSRPVWNIVTSIRKLNPTGDTELIVLDTFGGVCAYFDDRCQNVPAPSADTNCMDYLSRNRVNVIVTTGELRETSSMANDPQCRELFVKPEKYGFFTTRIRGTDIEILAANSLK